MRYKKGYKEDPCVLEIIRGEFANFMGPPTRTQGEVESRSDEINLIQLMYLDLSATKRCSFWRHGFRKQVLLSRWKYAKWLLDRPTNQGNVVSRLMKSI